MNTQYTPGPWKADGHDGKTKIIIESQWGEVCRCDPDNAPLIAAAPELLKALESVCADWDMKEEVLFNSIRKARSSIAKARGIA